MKPEPKRQPKRPLELSDAGQSPSRRTKNRRPQGWVWAIPLIAFASLIALGGGLATWMILKPRTKPDEEVQALPVQRRNASGDGNAAVEIAAPVTDTWKENGIHITVNGSKNDDALMLILTVQSTDPDKRINLRTWADIGATITDSKGNRLASRNHDLDILLIRSKFAELKRAGVGSGPVDADSPRYDLLFFDLPVSTAQYVDISLSGRNVERSGSTIKLRVRREEWEQRK